VENLQKAVDAARTKLQGADTDAQKLLAAKQLSGLETQLATAEAKALSLKNQLSAINYIKWGGMISGFGRAMQRMGQKFTMYVGAPLAALGISSFNAFKDYELALARLKSALPDAGEEIEKLNQAALNMSETIPVSYEEIMAIMTSLAKAGVPVGEIDGMTLALARMSAVTGMTAEEVGTSMVMFMNSMGLPMGNVDQLGAALVQLADASIATEADIFDMATRMAATGSLAGMSATDVLSLAAAFASMGVDAQAGGSAASKLMKQMQLAAETGKDVEGFAKVMGASAEQFTAGWNQSPADSMLAFFQGLSDMDTSGQQSVLAMLDEMGLTEIRLSNLVALGAKNPDMFESLMGTGAKGFEDNTALVKKAGDIFNTTSGQMDMLANATRNAQADLGENVADTFQPLIDKVGELVKGFGELDEETQTRWVEVMGALVVTGPAVAAFGGLVKHVGNLITFVGKVKGGEADGFKKLMSALAGPVGGWLLVAAGLAGVVTAINSIKSPAEQVVEALQNIEISIDETSKNETLAAIRQVREEADALSGDRKTELEGAAAAVESGYGTKGMFGESLEYARLLSEGEIKAASSSYRGDLAELNRQFKEAKDAGDEELAGIIGQQITERTANYDAQVAAAKLAYTEQVGTLIDGMMKAQPEAKAALERAAQEYDLYAMVASALNSNAGEMGEEAWNGLIENIRAGSEKLGFESGGVTSTMLFSLHDDLLASLNKNIGLVNEGELGFTLLNTLFGDPKNWEMLDVTQTKGALDGMLELMDLKGAAEKAGKDGGIIGLYINQGIADGMNSAESGITDKPEEIKNKLVANLKAAFEMRSPSALMAREGVNISAGIAMGIDQGGAQVFAAMSALQEAMVAQAAAMGAAVAAAFNNNLTFRLPNATGGGVNVNVNSLTAMDIYNIRKGLTDASRRAARGYGAG